MCRSYNAATFWSSIGIGSPVCAAAYDPRQTWSPGRTACGPSVLSPGEDKEGVGSLERIEKMGEKERARREWWILFILY